MRSVRLKRSEAYANFAKLKRRLRSYQLKRFEVYVNFARLLTRMSVKFVVAKHSSQMLRGYANFEKLSTLIRNFTVCDSKHFESTWLSALNFISVKVAKL